MAILAYIIERLKEPSTYAGLAGLLAFFGVKVAPEVYQAVIGTLVGIAGLIAVLFPDNKPSA